MAAGANVLTDFANLLSKATDLAFRDNRDKQDKVYDKYTKAGDTSEADFRSRTVVGLGQMAYTTELGQFHKDRFEEGEERISTWVKYTIGVVHSEELYEDMLKSSRVRKDKTALLKNMAAEMAESAVWTKEVICSQFQSQATSTTAIPSTSWRGTFRDGLALASASHQTAKAPVQTVSNLQTAASMTQLALQEGITMLNNVVSEEGRPQAPVKEVYLVYGRFHEWRVPELLQTVGQVDTANNNINTLKASGVKITPILNPYLSNTFTGWQLIDAKGHQLFRFEAKEPTYSMERDINTGAYIHKSVMRFGIDALSYKGICHNAGV